jgi:hypothetical protein
MGNTQDTDLYWYRYRVPYVEWRVDVLSSMLKDYRDAGVFV